MELTVEDQRELDKILSKYTVIPIMKAWENYLKWADALESGEYSQTRNVLRDENGYCCLGVLCDVSKLGEWIKHDDEDGLLDPEQLFTYKCFDEGERNDVLPEDVMGFIGDYSDTNPYILEEGGSDFIARGKVEFSELNDTLGLNFKQIAAIIRLGVELGKMRQEMLNNGD